MTRRPLYLEPDEPNFETDADEANADEDGIRISMERAHSHAQLALSETVAVVRALLDILSLVVTGVPAARNQNLRELAQLLDQFSSSLAASAASPPSQMLLDALDAQIARWERRSKNDPDARAVLRAFLGLREILWESGFRSSPEAGTSPN